MLVLTFLLLHVITAAAWFGMGLRLATQARAALALDRPAALALADDVQRTVRFMGLFLVLTLVFAVILFGLDPAYRVQARFHTALLLIVVLVALHYAVLQPAWKKLRQALADGADAVPYRKRVAMVAGVGQLLWLAILGLMFWHRAAVFFRS